MTAASLALGVRFAATSSGTGDFVDFGAVTGYRAGNANLVNGKIYRYRAENASLSEWEYGYGAWASGTNTLARTTVSFSSTGAKVAFVTAPQVAIIPFVEDILSFTDAMALTSGEKKQAHSNLFVPCVVTIYLSGTGTHNVTAGCTRLRVRAAGGGGGGAGSGTSGGGSGGTGGTTTFGSSTITSLGGAGGLTNSAGGVGGAKTALAGSPLPVGIVLDGCDGGPSGGLPSATNNTAVGGCGGVGPFGGAGSGGGGTGPAVPTAGKPNTGGGGGGAAAAVAGLFPGAGGGGSSPVDAIINSPNSSYPWAVGAGGVAGAAGTSGTAGAPGGSGGLIVEEYFGS